MAELKYKKSKSYHDSMKEMGLGGRAKRVEAFGNAMFKSLEKKAGEILEYPNFGETDDKHELVDGKIVTTKTVICSLTRGDKLTLLKDCTDGQNGIYYTDKGTFFTNFTVVRKDHPRYERAKALGYIK